MRLPETTLILVLNQAPKPILTSSGPAWNPGLHESLEQSKDPRSLQAFCLYLVLRPGNSLTMCQRREQIWITTAGQPFSSLYVARQANASASGRWQREQKMKKPLPWHSAHDRIRLPTSLPLDPIPWPFAQPNR